MEAWKEYIENSTLNGLPADYVRSVGKYEKQTISVPGSCASSIKALAKQLNQSVETVLVAIFTVLVFRLSGDEDVTVGYADESGFSYARYSQFSKTTKLSDVIKAVIDGEKIAKSHPLKTLSNSITQTVFAKSGTVVDSEQFDLIVTTNNDFEFSATFNTLLFKTKRVQYLLEQLIAISNAEDIPVCEIDLVTTSQVSDGVIPDPKKDLDWNGFRGAIQDIFAENAAKFPERECIVETANPLLNDSKTRSFNYKQIDEASNIVAHHLVKGGIVVDDVVMIYAYRGVDLVIAVMGVLKAGATFSVIDPAYPPARQNIYLSVAKPRGLIVLKKAGKLSPIVTDYIEENLDLKVDLTDLELLDNGEVKADQDISAATELKSSQTGVKVGPDNHPTLSFTSGSEGIPKGVRGRHFSLAYYFPWMSQRFGLGENDRFTMLSGIAHDPIQRDMFTPLFFGARLYVPTADDIGTPGRLAEWMAENDCTVTHLTPAMGQLLSAQATAHIPSLRNAFFVGDILTKRDCEKLQALAKNTAIINMYGTTETQRAVSYFRVPSVTEDPEFLQTQKDTIAAGTGMHNVQMLVVNRNSTEQICGVGEIGEIYVRAGGLSDGYLQLPDMTAQKFLTSWFVPEGHWKSTEPLSSGWLGPRDRLYRTGDLGRYLPDGNTEVSGRADDQVKIRGFRIELGEINTHLSRHPNIRENVTLVRKSDEPTLVAYIVPEIGKDSHFVANEDVLASKPDISDVVKGLVMYQPLIKDVRSYLKTKLPSYAVPTHIIPINKMPLNPNGKIDKPKLPFPNADELENVISELGGADEDSTVNWSDTEKKVWELWLSVLPSRPPSVELDDTFFDLGGHSILATKMIFEARSRLQVPSLPLGAVFSYPSIREFANAISELSKGAANDDAPAQSGEADYAADADKLVKALPAYVTAKEPVTENAVVFLTGATGFLGSFILRNLLERPQIKKVYVQVRAKSEEHALERVKNTGLAYGIWKDEYASRVQAITGSLESTRLGLSNELWNQLVNEVDVVIHNGALVHWVYPYSTLRGPNVIGTLNMMSLCAEGKPKYFTFVSSTSVIDSDHYFNLSDKLVASGKEGIPESDDLEGSRTGLGTGYGQSKWAAEHILREAGKHHGLRGNIVRPGYVVGESKSGISNTDDFLIRMLKGCEEIGEYPNIKNTVNMVPVDHVARLTAASALNASIFDEFKVVHVTAHPRMTFDQMVDSLNSFGYSVKKHTYPEWKVALEKHVVETGDSALFPLLHFVLGDLPSDSRAPELDDTNAKLILKSDAKLTKEDYSAGFAVDKEILSRYVSFLVAIDFMAKPQVAGKLPATLVTPEVIKNFANAGGRNSK